MDRLGTYTPGPWCHEAGPDAPIGSVVTEAGEPLAQTQQNGTHNGSARMAQNAMRTTNARLIAAAPDLHKALLKCLLVLSGEAHSKSELVRATEDGVSACKKATEAP